jgi:Na+/melibiose symporter-like transporter
MSGTLGYTVNNYDPAKAGQNDAFLHGMHIAFIIAALICVLGAVITIIRMQARRKENREAL